ncbi:hypothetical protein [Marinicrinis sediminis]|uniref:Uncharacterized protein n=1 Tax=Marinicrinis sediminis TaxID=1652465 RepID=A0ABW5RC96_9BACL
MKAMRAQPSTRSASSQGEKKTASSRHRGGVQAPATAHTQESTAESLLIQAQTTMGNQAMVQMMKNHASGRPVIQRSLDDAEVKTWSQNTLSALWNKMRTRSEGKESIPYFSDVRTQLLDEYEGETFTERVLAEQIILNAQFRNFFISPRLHVTEDEVPVREGEEKADTIRRVIAACRYYHATFAQHKDAIMAGGLKAKRGGQGEGVSTHGRDDVDAQATYNNWSLGHVFITPSLSEANGYRTKMQDSGNGDAVIIHVFSHPTFTRDELKVDIDSKAGLKYEGDLKGIGDGETLNAQAISIIHRALQGMNVSVSATTSEIQDVYASM